MTYKKIALKTDTYEALKKRGTVADTFDSIVQKLLYGEELGK